MRKTMSPLLLLILISIASGLASCAKPATNLEKSQQFETELRQLSEYFHIPGTAAIVLENQQVIYEKYTGFADIDSKQAMNASTAIPTAAITKLFTAILAMKAVESGKLSLDQPVNAFIKTHKVSSAIKVKHVLSHTSQGSVGKQFYYDNRFAWLTQVIEQSYGLPLKKILQNEIISPLNLSDTFALINPASLGEQQAKHHQRNIAQPYSFNGRTFKGFIDYGYSASTGIVSTVRDLARLSLALDNNHLISQQSKTLLFKPFKANLPYGYGVFTQTLGGVKLIWAYGQYDCYSSLLLKVPAKNLTFIIAGNNNLISDPARLTNGDIGNSLFALSFLKNYVFELVDQTLLENLDNLANAKHTLFASNAELARKKYLAQALADSFLAMYKPGWEEKSKAMLRYIFSRDPELESYGSASLLYNLTMLKQLSKRRGQADFSEFDRHIKRLGNKLLAIDNNNPYVNLHMANFYSLVGDKNKARQHYTRIAKAKNFASDWYTNEAKNWLESNGT